MQEARLRIVSWHQYIEPRDEKPPYLSLTSKQWRFQSGCNHSTAYVDQGKGYESSEFLTESPNAALLTGNAH